MAKSEGPILRPVDESTADTGGSYYAWLAKQKNWREPWRSWAELERRFDI
ncbi:hypothetical protein [Bryobacter aggregatus]|nr:hypothetical protein [Bryobacter aggregatus]